MSASLLRIVFLYALLAALVSSALGGVVLTAPSSVNAGQSYSVTAYENGPMPNGPPMVSIYKNGTLVAQSQGGTGYSSVDTTPGTVNWMATSSFGGSANKTTTIIATNTPPVGAYDSLTSSVTVGKTITASGWAADNEMGAPITRVDILLDGVDVANATLGGARQDVATALGRPDYLNSGWTWTYNTSSLALGTHTVSVVYTDNQGGTTAKPAKNFTVSTSTPTTTLTIADSTIFTGQAASLTSVTVDPGAELTAHYLEYRTPGSSTWISHSPNWATTGNSYWTGSECAQHTLSATKTLATSGTWSFRSRGRDSAGRYSDYMTVDVIVSTTPPVASLSTSASSILVGGSVMLTGSFSDSFGDLDYASIDYIQPGGAWVAGSSAWAGSLWTGTPKSSHTLTPSRILAVPGTWQFRARGRDAQNVFGSYSSIVNVAVAAVTSTSDFDGDGMPDWWEDLYGFNASSSADANEDLDGDSVTNKNEYIGVTDPLNKNGWFGSGVYGGALPVGATIVIIEPDGTSHGVVVPGLELQ